MERNVAPPRLGLIQRPLRLHATPLAHRRSNTHHRRIRRSHNSLAHIHLPSGRVQHSLCELDESQGGAGDAGSDGAEEDDCAGCEGGEGGELGGYGEEDCWGVGEDYATAQDEQFEEIAFSQFSAYFLFISFRGQISRISFQDVVGDSSLS